MAADVTFSSITELRAYLNEKIVPNTENKIRAQEHNNIENGIIDFLGFSVINIESAVEPDVAQLNTVQYNDEGTIWMVDRSGVAIVMTPAPVISDPVPKKFIAYASQSGTSAPTLNVLVNTIGETATPGRISAGVYFIDFSNNPLTSNKTVFTPQQRPLTNSISGVAYFSTNIVSDARVTFVTSSAFNSATEVGFNDVLLEITVYTS